MLDMGLFDEKEDYVDYTLLKKKGILKLKQDEIKRNTKMTGDFIDFTSFNNDNRVSSNPAENAPVNNNFSFLADMASAGATSSTTSVSTTDDKELSALKIKIDDIEYKLDKFIERIDKLEENLNKQ